MKKLSLFGVLLLSAVVVQAQPDGNTFYWPPVSEEVIRAVIIFTGMYLIGTFILIFFRTILDHKLKQRMLEKGVSDDIAQSFLRTDSRDVRSQTMKWFIIFMSIGIGLVFVNVTQPPLGIHSVAILCFSIAFGYLAYYFFVKKNDKK